MRLFLGVPLPAPLRDELAAAAAAFDGLRAVDAATIHLTIRFLGDAAAAEPILEAVRPIAAAHAPFELELTGLGVFPDLREARVVWARMGRGSLPAGALAAGVEGALTGLGFPRERRAWKGHVTIGRYRPSRKLSARLLDRDSAFGTALADRLVLYRSTLSPDGARHEVVEEMSLGAGK